MKKILIVISILILFPVLSHAQCAICQAVVESSKQSGSSVADGLNDGILYLMAFPYILMGSVGYAIYRIKKTKS